MFCFDSVVQDKSMHKYWLLHYKFLVVSFKNISQQNNEHEYIYVHMYNTVGKYFIFQWSITCPSLGWWSWTTWPSRARSITPLCCVLTVVFCRTGLRQPSVSVLLFHRKPGGFSTKGRTTVFLFSRFKFIQHQTSRANKVIRTDLMSVCWSVGFSFGLA